METFLNALPATLLALGTLYAGIKGLKAVLIEGDREQTEAWIRIRDSYELRMTALESQAAKDSERIQSLEAAERASVRQVRQAEGRILELEREKKLSDDIQRQTDSRLVALEAEHRAVLESLRLYKNGIKILLSQLKKLNIVPEWNLPEE